MPPQCTNRQGCINAPVFLASAIKDQLPKYAVWPCLIAQLTGFLVRQCHTYWACWNQKEGGKWGRKNNAQHCNWLLCTMGQNYAEVAASKPDERSTWTAQCGKIVILKLPLQKLLLLLIAADRHATAGPDNMAYIFSEKSIRESSNATVLRHITWFRLHAHFPEARKEEVRLERRKLECVRLSTW